VTAREPHLRVLVCGGRNFVDYSRLHGKLDEINSERGPIAEIIHGDARGADTLAAIWAADSDIPIRAFPANWEKFGRRAGPVRNRQMLDEAFPNIVVAFPGGAGTANMIRQAEERGILVILG
jgi:aspartokinase-like uncharacterized kinase